MSKAACLYKHYDSEGILLYVGITSDIDGRTRQHRNASPWYPHVRKTVVTEFETKGAARKAEASSIRSENPLHNVAHNSIEKRIPKRSAPGDKTNRIDGMPISLNDIEVIVALDEHRHYGLAAKMLNISQPSISARIGRIHKRLGYRIFHYSPSTGVTVTKQGRVLVSDCKLLKRYMQMIKNHFNSPKHRRYLA